MTTLKQIEQVACEIFNVTTDQIKSRTRRREVVQARQAAMWCAVQVDKELCKPESFASIGQYFGGFDHATVHHAKKTINNLIDVDRRFRFLIDMLKAYALLNPEFYNSTAQL